jgi:cohesin loading factor subunit SCC2
MCAATLANELAGALRRVNDVVKKQDEHGASSADADAHAFGAKLKAALAGVWAEAGGGDLFDQDDATRADAVAEAVGAAQGLRHAFGPLLHAIVGALDAPAIFMRSKALRALAQIIVVDPAVLALVCAAGGTSVAAGG